MKISYSKRETKNLGNFESTSVEIKVEDEVNFEKETIDECYNRLEKFVLEKLSTQFNATVMKATVTAKLKPPKEVITVEVVREKMSSLIKTNINNRNRIKLIGANYNIKMLEDMKEKDLIDFYNKLNKLD